MDEEILGSVLHGIKPKDYTPIQVRPTPEFGGIQLTEEQQAKKDNMESVKDGEILPLGGFADTVEAQWESAKDLVKSTDVYKNLFGNSAPDDNRLEQSEKLGSALGIAPQLIASDPDMYKAAVTTYERQRNAAALNNQPFSAKTLNELYPELDTEDPVATTIALKDYTNILKNREAAAQGAAVYTMPESKLTDLSNVIGYLYDTGAHFAGTAYEAGQALDAQSELMYKASIGEISDEEVEKAIPGLMNAQKAYNAEIGDSYVAKIVGETISQLSMQKNMIMRGAAEILAPIAPLAQPLLAATKTNLPQIATLGAASAASAVGATGAVAGAAVTGATALAGLIALGTASVFVGTYRAEAGQAYWDWRAKKDKNGKSVYTREQAIGHAKRVGVINAAIEAGAMELALKGITKVWGSDAAKAVIKNEAAMKKLIGAGRAAVGAKAIGYGAKQFAKVAAPEIAEEGLQSLSSDLDTRFFGKEKVPVREMMGNAVEAMIEAVPSVVGMSIGGAALAGAGAHRAMKRITGLSEMKDAVIEFKRENERSMLQKLMDLRAESSLYKKAPETYRKTLQNQLDHTGSGTLYIDASAAAENEKTHDALNKLVEDGTITAKELDDAIKTGKPLEVETGKYMQTATPETHEALSDYTTMDKGEKTIHAIREERQRMKDMIDIVTMTREKREAAATEKILNDHFSDDTDIGREDRDTAREILSGGLDHIEDICKTILQEAKDAWGKLTGVKELQDYMERRKTQDANTSNEKGVDMFDVGEGKDRVHLRISKNPDWYQDFYGAYGRAPNQRELYDIAQEKIIAENDKGDEESKTAIAEIEEAKKRVESIERVSETLKSLNKEDLIAQTLLDPETYEEAYKPLLEEIKVAGNGAVTKAARDSALILAKLAENFHKNYGVPLKLAMIAAGEVSPETAHQLNQSAIENELQLVKEKYWNTEEWMKATDGTLTKLTERQWLITHSETFREWFGDWETVEKVTKLYYGNPIVMTEGGFKEKLEKAARDNGINIAADADSIRKEIKTIFKSLYPGKELSKGYREPGRVKNLDGELISITVSSAKELRHHSTNPRTLFLAVNLDSVIENATFLYEEVKDESRVKKSNQTTLAYRYYATRVVVNGEECIARIIVRKDKNGNLYFYDGDITSNEQIKKDLPKYLYPDTKTGQNLGKSLFTHSIQEWLAKVKETTDKIGGNGEVLASVVNDFEESSTYHQMAGEYAHNVLSGKSTKKDMAERQLDADEKSFADSVDRFIAGKEKSPMVRVMTTPLVLKLTGAEVLPVEIAKTDKELGQKLNVYFQNKYQGSYDRNANVIELFDGANESTVIHEGAHMFLSMLENMSQMSEENVATYFNGDTAKARAALKSMQGDLSTIRSWAAFSEDHLSEYKGTILEKEFTEYAEDIRAGKAGAMERWMQERFARGFEKYLMDGSAPTKEMQGVFRRFKKWLTDIYKTAKNLGNVELTPEIKDIFDRMISTESEINAWAAQRKLEAIDKTVNVNQSELGNLKAWAESVKDKALEKAMSYYLHMVREEAIENFKASISSEEERTSFIESLGEENEIYQIETIYNSDTFPTKKDRDEFLQMAGLTEKDLKEKLRAAGGTTEERWNKHIEEMVQHYREEALTPEAIRGMAEEILRSPEGMAKKSRIEAMLLEKKVSAYIHLVNSMQMELKRSKDKKKTAREIRKRLGLVSEKETTEVDKQTDVIAKSEDKIAKLEKQKKLLKEQLEKAKAEAAAAKGENKSRKESQTILEGNMRALEAELEKERNARAKADNTTKDAELTAADLAVQLQAMVDGLKESRNAMRFDMREIKEDARNTLGGEKLSHATSWRWWENKAQIAEARAMKAAAGNDWEGAAYWKREQAQCLTMAKFARANEEEIHRTLHGGGGKVTTALLNENGMERYGILGILNRISRTDKPVLMKDDARYFVQHMAYVLGLTKKDGILPIDESGQERPFSWRWLAIEMNPMQAMDDDRYMAEDIIPGWMRSAFDGSSPMKLKDLTMDQFREMAKVMKAVYKLGRREYEGNTLGTSFDDAAQKIHDEILGNWTHRVATPGLKNQTATSLDRLGTKIHSLIKDITLPEILIERLGKSAAEYFYKPMDKAAAHLRELKSAARVTFRKNFAIYSRKEWTAIRSKKLYTVGLDERGKPVSYTKEQLLAMALNFGTKSNRERLIETLWLSDTLNTDEKTILDMLDKNLTDKDWDFVESVWEHLNSYWGERNKVQNDLYGTPLGKVQGEDFTLKSGRVIHGAYYRIKYDPLSSTKTSNFSTTDIAKMGMQNISSFSLGMGSTKQRAGTSGGQKLRLDLDVYVEAVNEAMQHIAMREATVDVYKLLNRKEVVTAIENTAGPETLSLLQGWAKDCWHSSIKDMSEWDSTLGRARRRFNFTTMGFRFSTALLNIGNITGMMDRMGAMNALKAVGDFYFHGNIIEQRRFIQTKSTMMRDRGATIDRDMYMQDRLPVGKNESELRSKIEHGKYGVDTLNSKAYWLIQATDEMFSLPEWLFTYRHAMAVMEIDGKLTREEMDAEAVRLADKAVRETFGSNETKDQTSFIRKNGILAQMTTFYSYTNLVTNQFIRAGYTLYDKGDVKPLLAVTWYWWILGALVETTLREIGDDSDDEDKWKKKFLHVIASGGPIGGVPLAREAVPWTVDFFTGKSFGSAAPDAPFFDTLKHMENFLKAAKKGDLIEMGRGATKAITRTSIPVPDTITDAFWNFMRMACTDTEFTMWDWFRKSLWDKTLKEKKK
nr:MAG TPA: crystallin beta/gamma motif-containing protein [Caudoviricetes sp.]